MTAVSAGNGQAPAPTLADAVAARVAAGARFAGLFGTALSASPALAHHRAPASHGPSYGSQKGQERTGALLLSAYLATDGDLETVEAVVPGARPGTRR